MAEFKDLGDLVALFMVKKVCKKKDLNPRYILKKGSKYSLEIKTIYFVPETKPFFDLIFLTFLYKVHF